MFPHAWWIFLDVRVCFPARLVRYATERVCCVHAWLIRYGVGKRIKLPYTRKIIDAIHSGELLTANYKKTEVFGLEIPTEINGVPSEILDPINTVSSIIACNSFLKIFITTRWSSNDVCVQWTDKAAYKGALLQLAGLFKNNFEVFASYKIGDDSSLTDEILAAGPNFWSEVVLDYILSACSTGIALAACSIVHVLSPLSEIRNDFETSTLFDGILCLEMLFFVN
jgi:hypothetical protein